MSNFFGIILIISGLCCLGFIFGQIKEIHKNGNNRN